MNVFPVLNNFTINFIGDSSIFFHGYWSFNCSCLEGQVWRPSVNNYIWLLVFFFFFFLTCTYLRFSKNWSRTSLHSTFSVLFLWSRNLLFFLKRNHEIHKLKKNWLAVNSNTNLTFPPSCPDYPVVMVVLLSPGFFNAFVLGNQCKHSPGWNCKYALT